MHNKLAPSFCLPVICKKCGNIITTLTDITEMAEKDCIPCVDCDNLEDSRKKPPLGVVPKYYFERSRIQDIARAIFEYAGEYRNIPEMATWAKELEERIIEWNETNKGISKKDELSQERNT